VGLYEPRDPGFATDSNFDDIDEILMKMMMMTREAIALQQ